MAEKIASKYNISLELTPYRYQFTGNDRNATVSSVNDLDISGALCSQQVKYTSVSARPKYDNIFTIKRARILSTGAAGLRAPEGNMACLISLGLIDEDDNTLMSRLFLRLMEWNEWEDVNVDLRPFDTLHTFTDEEKLKSLSYRIGKVVTKFYIDDYNIQSAYIGQYVTPVLNLDVETAGMVNYDSIGDKYYIF